MIDLLFVKNVLSYMIGDVSWLACMYKIATKIIVIFLYFTNIHYFFYHKTFFFE